MLKTKEIRIRDLLGSKAMEDLLGRLKGNLDAINHYTLRQVRGIGVKMAERIMDIVDEPELIVAFGAKVEHFADMEDLETFCKFMDAEPIEVWEVGRPRQLDIEAIKAKLKGEANES